MNPWKEKCDRAIKEWREQGESGMIIMHPETVEDADYIMSYLELANTKAVVMLIVNDKVCVIGT